MVPDRSATILGSSRNVLVRKLLCAVDYFFRIHERTEQKASFLELGRLLPGQADLRYRCWLGARRSFRLSLHQSEHLIPDQQDAG